MKRLVIAVDCDDVLVRTTPYFVDAYNVQYGTAVKYSDAHGIDPVAWEADQQEVLSRWASLTETDAYKQLQPDPEEAAILRELALQHELHLITARKEEERAFTQSMLDRELSGVFTSMEFVGWGGSKGQVCQRIHADVLIDDNVSHLHDALAHGLPAGGAIAFGDYEWNKAETNHKDLVHCHDWVAVKKVIDRIAQQ